MPNDDERRIRASRELAVYAVVALVLLAATGFFLMLLGPLLIILVATGLVLLAVGWMHYWLWGREMIEDAADAEASEPAASGSAPASSVPPASSPS